MLNLLHKVDKNIFSKLNAFHWPSFQKERKKYTFFAFQVLFLYPICKKKNLFYTSLSHSFFFHRKEIIKFIWYLSLLFRPQNEILSTSSGINKQCMYWFSISLLSCSILCPFTGQCVWKEWTMTVHNESAQLTV